MSSFFSKLFRGKQNQEFLFFADVGTSSVKTVVAEKRDGALFLSRNIQAAIGGTGAKTRMQKIERVLRDRIVSVIKERGSVPQKLHIGVSGALLNNRIETARLQRTNPEKKLTETELQELIQKSVKEFSGGDVDATLVFFSVVEIALDGYAVSELPPAAFPATVAISFFLSYAPRDEWAELAGIARIFGGVPVSAYPNQYLVGAEMVRRLAVSEGVLVDAGGESTEVSVVNEKKLQYVARVDYGGRQIADSVGKTLNVSSAQEANRMKKQSGHLWFADKDKARAVEEGMRDAARAWRAKLDAVLGAVYAVAVPPAFFIFGGGANFSPIFSALEEQGGEDGVPAEKIIARKVVAEDFNLPYAPGSERLHGPDAVALAALIANAYDTA